MAAGLRDEAVDLAEPEAAALADFLGGEERLEGAGPNFRRHALAVVGDGDCHEIPGRDVGHQLGAAGVDPLHAGTDPQCAAARHRVARVDHQVEQRGLELRRVDIGRHRAGRQVYLELDRLRTGAAQYRLELADQPVDVVDFGAQRLAPREGEQLLGQLGAAFGGALGAVDDAAPLPLVAQRTGEEVEAVGDDGQ